MPIYERYSRFVDVNGVKTHYLEAGSGDEMILLHGGGAGCSSIDWVNNIELLSRHFHVYALDELGYGLTEKVADNSISGRIQHAIEFGDALNINSAHYVGHSLGAYMSTTISLDYPKKTRSLVIVDSGSTAPLGTLDELGRRMPGHLMARNFKSDKSKENVRRILENVIHNNNLITEDYVDTWWRYANYPDVDKVEEERAIENRPILTDRLIDLAVPTMIVWGAQDTCAPLYRAIKLHELIPNSRMHIFDQASHCVMIDHAEYFSNLLIAFCGDNRLMG